jgi:hypothetical protein
MNLFFMILRAATISIRYATTTEIRIREQSTKEFSDKDNEFEFLLSGWMRADPHFYDLHIHQAMVRMQIENTSFLYKNVQPLSNSVYA